MPGIVREYYDVAAALAAAAGGGGEPPGSYSFVDSAVGVATSGTTVDVTVADISGLQDGDLLIALVVTYDSNGSWSASGWSSTDFYLATPGTDHDSDVLTKTASSESGTWTFTDAVDGAKVAIVLAYRDAAIAESTPTPSEGVNDLTPQCATVAVAGDREVITMMVGAAGSGMGFSAVGAPSGWNAHAAVGAAATGGTGQAMAAVAFATQTGPGTPTAADWTHVTDDASTDYTLRAIAIEAA